MEGKQSVGTAQMYRNLGQRLRNLVFNPVSEWLTIHRESYTLNDMLGTFALPLIGLVTFGTFVSHLINQQTFILELALKNSLLIFMSLLGGLFLAWYMVFFLMKYFYFISSREVAAKLTIYSTAPLYIVSLVTALIPEFFFIQILAVYSFYLSWIGIRNLAGSAHEKKFIFSLIVGFLVLSLPYVMRLLLLNLITI